MNWYKALLLWNWKGKPGHLDLEYYNAVLCYKLHEFIGWKYPRPVNGLMVPKFPRIQNWLSSQIPYDSW